MRKTKIVCTMGPNTNDREMMKQLALSGMDVARFNFSHGDHEEHKGRLELLKSVREELGIPVAALLDTKGPEIRTGVLKDDKKVTLVEGQEYVLTTKEVPTDDKICYINYEQLHEDVVPGNKILIDDGLIAMEVEKVEGTEIHCRVLNGGELGAKKGVNVPNVKIKLPALTDKDREDIIFGIHEGFDFIAASFVRTADAIREIKKILEEHDYEMGVIAKIENAEGIENLDEIIEAADGIMVARGDMGVEIPAEKVPYIQKTIIRKCNEACKIVITATQMLDSMIRNPRPTRAEVSDVANAIYDGTDAVMLSGETAMGKYPVEALSMMAHIAENTESHLNYEELLLERARHRNSGISAAVSYASVMTAHNLNAAAIVTPSMSGYTPRMVSEFRPQAAIVATSPNAQVLRQLQLVWGVKAIYAPYQANSDEVVNSSVELAKLRGLVKEDDLIVLTAGMTGGRTRDQGVTNSIRVLTVD